MHLTVLIGSYRFLIYNNQENTQIVIVFFRIVHTDT